MHRLKLMVFFLLFKFKLKKRRSNDNDPFIY
jgi:hypothetical protein